MPKKNYISSVVGDLLQIKLNILKGLIKLYLAILYLGTSSL